MTEWILDGSPIQPGWYPTLKCWDPEEGIFPSATEWRDGRWQTTDPVTAFLPIALATKDAAEKIAYKHDPDWKDRDAEPAA